MSESSAHEHPRKDEVRGTPDVTPADLAAELSAEIADHLAAAAGELRANGHSVDDATRTALARFGDVARIRRQCWWIWQGEEIMIRAASVALLVVLALGVVVVAIGGWQVQRNLATRTEELSERLAALAATQQAMLAQQRPPEITGTCYYGDSAHPAANVEVQVYRFTDTPSDSAPPGLVTRRIQTDVAGHFATGPLQPADYCILAPLKAPEGVASDALYYKMLQSEPVFLTLGGAAEIQLDLLAGVPVEVALVTPLPDKLPAGNEEMTITFGLSFARFRDELEYRPISPGAVAKAQWPVPFMASPRQFPPSTLKHTYYVPAGEYKLSSCIGFSTQRVPGSYETMNPIIRRPDLKQGDCREPLIVTLKVSGEPLETRLVQYLQAKSEYRGGPSPLYAGYAGQGAVTSDADALGQVAESVVVEMDIAPRR